ncbi:BTB/POZ domain-containing protein 6-B-like, partial [Stylophora pistillata]|uniref:BTB/POZ domain-containing protein 6-B-like n=1 Tax=Stylophora pistillata TaxID=50429 RepID=UPI000C056B98
ATFLENWSNFLRKLEQLRDSPNTKEAVTSDVFVTVERSLVKSVVKRGKLTVKEVDLFKAADHWATNECERQGVTPDGETKRRILGEDIVKAIRFPLISQEEFVSAVFDSHILTLQEVGAMMKHYCGVLKSPLPFKKTMRGRVLYHRSNRFQKFSSGCYYSEGDSIEFTVSKPIMLRGVQYFGSKHSKHTVVTEVKDTIHNSCLGKDSGTYHSKKDAWNNFYGFDVSFESALCLEANKQYTLVSVFKGLVSCYGLDGQKIVESGGVRFTFSESNCDFNSSSGTRGQFPALIFS